MSTAHPPSRRGARALAAVAYRPPCGPLTRLVAGATRWPGALLAVWRVAAAVGHARRRLVRGWPRLVLWVALAAGVVWVVQGRGWPSFAGVLAVLVLAAALAAARAVWLARERVLIEPFADLSAQPGGDGKPATAPGLSTLLVSELMALRDLFEDVDAGAGIAASAGAGQPIQATLQLEDVSAFLRDAVVSDAKVSVGPLALPIGTVLALVGRLAQGPQVTGSLQLVRGVDAEGAPRSLATLTASYASRERLASWTVERELPTGDAGSLAQTAIVRELVVDVAAQMFAELALSQTTSWRASQRLLEGLGSYRLAQESRRDRVLNLRRAETLFVEALGHEQSLPLGRYNLGVVYHALAQDARGDEQERLATAAEAALRGELDVGGGEWQAFYALAVVRFEQQAHADVPPLCDRVVELARDPSRRAAAYDLRGLCERRDGEPEALARALRSRRRAAAYALRALVRAELLRDPTQARALASRCLLNLGVGLSYTCQELVDTGRPHRRPYRESCGRAAAGRAARRLLRRPLRARQGGARRRRSGDGRAGAARSRAQRALGHRALGRPRARRGGARHRRRRAPGVPPTPSACSSWPVRPPCAHAPRSCARRTRTRSRSWPRPTTGSVSQAESERARRTAPLVAGLAALGSDDRPGLRVRLEDEPDDLVRGHVALRLGDLEARAGDQAAAATAYRSALEAHAGYPAELRASGANGLLARALAALDERPDALRWAQAAVAVDPTSAWERELLGDVYEQLGDLEEAIGAYESALLWQPASATLHENIGRSWWRLAQDSTMRDRRAEMHRRAVEHYEAALTLYGAADLGSRLAAHYALGRLLTDLGEYARAVPHFRRALASPARPAVQLMMAQAYLRSAGYADAETAAGEAIEAAEAALAADADASVGAELGDAWRAGELAAAAHCLLALSLIQRDVRQVEALTHIEAAERLLEPFGADANAFVRASTLELRGRLLLDQGDERAAVAALREAVGLWPDPEAYAHLAAAYVARRASLRPGPQRRQLEVLARRACERARELDASGAFDAAIGEVLAALDAPEPAVAASASSDGQAAPLPTPRA